MSYNYLIKKLSNLSFDRIFELQSNLFEIVEHSSGTVLDSVTDLDFMLFVLSQNSGFSINGNNQLRLSSAEIFKYTVDRMYYYNPAMLDTLITSKFDVVRWFDFTDLRTIAFDTAISHIKGAISKSASDYYSNFMYYFEVDDLPFYNFANINNFLIGHLANDESQSSYILEAKDTFAPLKLDSPFTVSGVVSLSSPGAVKHFLNFRDVTLNKYIFIRCWYAENQFRIHFYFNDDGGHAIYLTSYVSYIASDIVRFVCTSDGTTASVYMNDESPDSTAHPSYNSVDLTKGFFLDCDGETIAFDGNTFEFMVLGEHLSLESVEHLMSYYKTKFYLD